MLAGKYIPNLIAKPFEVSRDYAQIIYDQTPLKLDKVHQGTKTARACPKIARTWLTSS